MSLHLGSGPHSQRCPHLTGVAVPHCLDSVSPSFMTVLVSFFSFHPGFRLRLQPVTPNRKNFFLVLRVQIFQHDFLVEDFFPFLTFSLTSRPPSSVSPPSFFEANYVEKAHPLCEALAAKLPFSLVALEFSFFSPYGSSLPQTDRPFFPAVLLLSCPAAQERAGTRCAFSSAALCM